MAVSPSLEALRSDIDAFIGRFLDDRAALLPEASVLIDEIARVVEAGGKRLRPAFCYWGYRAGSGEHGDEIVAIAASFELLHTFAIVHDDIMDSATHRRGIPSTVARLGPAQALLVGDLALVLADAAFWSSGFPPDILRDAFAHFTTMREEVIAGQHLDIAASGREVDEAQARRIARLKSGSYSIEHPLAIGARLAGAPKHVLEGLSHFGRPLGEAFQLRDDLLGLFGDPATTGKPDDSDIREGKRHVPFALALARAGDDDRAELLALWGGGDALGTDDVERLRRLVEDSGARAATEALVAELSQEAATTLETIEMPPEARAALEELIAAAVTRAS